MTLTIHITEHGRVWPAEEIAERGEVFTTDAPLEDLQRALVARGYRVLDLQALGTDVSAEVEHDVPAVTGETVVMRQLAELFAMSSSAAVVRAAALELTDGTMLLVAPPTHRERTAARARCAAAINARRGAP